MARLSDNRDSSAVNGPSSLYSDSLRHDYLKVERDDLHHLKIFAELLEHFRLRPGSRVLEVGAGFGRYTRVLRSFGLAVLACEPDLKMLAQLEQKFAGDPLVSCKALSAEDLVEAEIDCDAVCGFHVLHHLGEAGLRGIAAIARRQCETRAGFKGWFFLEPNNLNPLYPLQIALTPGMRFSEEKGIWQTDYERQLGSADGKSPCLGRIGLFPPRGIFSRLPARITGWQTSLKPRRAPWSLYRIFGERCDSMRRTAP
jgi:SAM-dependent methyltransferase